MTDLLDSTVKRKTVQDGLSNIQDRIRHLFIDGLIVLISSALILTALDYTSLYHHGSQYDSVSIAVHLTVYLSYYLIMEYYFNVSFG